MSDGTGKHRGATPASPASRRGIVLGIAAVTLALVAVVVLVVRMSGSSTARDAGPLSGSPVRSATPAASDSAPAYVLSASPTPKAKPLTIVAPEHLRKLTPTEDRLVSLRLAVGQESAATTFTMASFNVLGNQHTSCKKKSVICQHPSWATGASRMRSDVPWINSQHFSIIGFQELEAPQYSTFMGEEPHFEGYPGLLKGARVDNTVVWNTDDWNMIEEHLVPIPYFYGQNVGIPYVRLQNKQTGREIWVLNTHNPADVHGGAQKWRVAATAIEIKLINQLDADGTPVLFTGDMNERQSFGCRITAPTPAGTGMHASAGGFSDKDGCHVARNTPIDWVLGTKPVTFTDDVYDNWGLKHHLTDHSVTRTTVSISGLTNPPVAVD